MSGSTSGVRVSSRKSVLVAGVGDEAHDDLVCSLVDSGFEVASARTDTQVLRFLAEASFQLLIVDGELPKTGGLGLLQEVRKRGVQTPAALVSDGAAMAAEERKIRELGIARAKPVDRKAILAKVRQMGA